MASFKIMTSQTGQQIITIHILPNIPRIVINCRLTCDAINFENKYSFLIEPFFYITEKSEQNYEYLKNEKNF